MSFCLRRPCFYNPTIASHGVFPESQHPSYSACICRCFRFLFLLWRRIFLIIFSDCCWYLGNLLELVSIHLAQLPTISNLILWGLSMCAWLCDLWKTVSSCSFPVTFSTSVFLLWKTYKSILTNKEDYKNPCSVSDANQNIFIGIFHNR